VLLALLLLIVHAGHTVPASNAGMRSAAASAQSDSRTQRAIVSGTCRVAVTARCKPGKCCRASVAGQALHWFPEQGNPSNMQATVRPSGPSVKASLLQELLLEV
jgi:hypothetical protein